MPEKIKALGLLSGGLDSTLAVKVMQDLGVEVKALNFSTGFCLTDHHRVMNRSTNRPMYNEGLRAAADLDVDIDIIDISEEYKDVLFHPKYGYGAGMNPCKDCRAFMLRKAKTIMEAEGAKFVFTGEVLGQRPMSQYRKALEIVEQEAGLPGLVLRPLSARLLPPTIPEMKGWIDRERLLDISGRSRKPQIALADEYGISNYPQPAGGCCSLPDPNYSRKLRDLMKHRGIDALGVEDFVLLKVGRHFRLPGGVKVIVGRDEGENAFLSRYHEGRLLLESTSHVGPITLVEGTPTPSQIAFIAGITARYGDGVNAESVRIHCKSDALNEDLEVTPLKTSEYEAFWV